MKPSSKHGKRQLAAVLPAGLPALAVSGAAMGSSYSTLLDISNNQN